MPRLFPLYILLSILMISCTSSDEKDEKSLIGTWESTPALDEITDESATFHRQFEFVFSKPNDFDFSMKTFTKESAQDPWKSSLDIHQAAQYESKGDFIRIFPAIEELGMEYAYMKLAGNELRFNDAKTYTGSGNLESGFYGQTGDPDAIEEAPVTLEFLDSIMITTWVETSRKDSSYLEHTSDTFKEIRPYADGDRLHSGLPKSGEARDTLEYAFTFMNGKLVLVETGFYATLVRK